jgi:hypothetical protein
VNDEHRAPERCDFEDRVISSFLDGEPGQDLPEAAAHLDRCPFCAEALRKARAIDALLAAQTRTDVEDSVADRLLAGVDEAARPTSAPRRRAVALTRRGWLAVAAALIALTVAYRWMSPGPPGDPEAGRSIADRHGPVVSAPPTTSPPTTSPPTTTSPHSGSSRSPLPSWEPGDDAFPVPSGSSVGARQPERPDFTRTDLLTRLKGDRVPGFDRKAVAVRVQELFESASAGKSVDSELVVEATRWQLASVRRGLLPSGRLLAAGRVLLGSRGALRRDLVALFREHESLVRRMARSWVGRDRVDPVVVGLAGALGLRAVATRVSERAGPQVDHCADQARRTGDRRCLAFLVELYLSAARRSDEARRERVGWFEDLVSGADATLTYVLKDKLRRTRSQEIRTLCEELAERLGLPETCAFWFARDGGSPPEPGTL